MGRTIRAGILGVCLLCFALAAAVSAGEAGKKAAPADSPHGRKDEKACIACHLSVPKAGSRPGKEGNLRAGGDIVTMCGSCHGEYRHMHPVKIAVAPDMRNPENLPLDRNGKITCITCHDVMQGAGVHRTRRAEGRGLCLNCHADSDILAQVNWYPTRLRKGEHGRLELKAVEFRLLGKKAHLGDSVLLYYYAKNVDSGDIVFGTNVLYDDGSHGDRQAKDSIYTLTEEAASTGGKRRMVYTGWVIDPEGRRSNTVTLAVEYE